MIPINPKLWLSFPLLVIVAACAGTLESSVPSPTEREPATDQLALERGGEELPDDVATRYMYDLSSRDRELGAAALEAVLDAQDERFISVLIEVMRGTEVGIFLGIDYDTNVSALENLSGESFGANWPAWVEWYGATDLTPPPGFIGWKGDVLSFIDPGFADFLQDDAPSLIRAEEIQWGGVSVDGIPALEPDSMMEEPMPAEDMATMTILARGEFYDLGGHPGTGTATVYELADGSRVLRFENFEVINGPQLHVWLVPPDPVPDAVGREIPGYFDAGPLKGNIGDQNYEIPADLNLADYGSVVIWCVPFRVPFNAAPLSPP